MSNYASRYQTGDGEDFGGGGGFVQGSQNNNTPGGSRRVEQTLRPVTIKQLLEAEASNTDSTITIQDIDVSNVSFCGVVRGIVRNPTNVLLQIEDGTGLIEVRKWTDSSDGENEGLEVETGIQVHDWVRVIGSPKIFNGKKHVAGLRLEKIEDYNEINYRLLDAVRVTLFHERGGSSGDGNKMNIDRPKTTASHGKIAPSKNPDRNAKQDKIMTYFETTHIPDEGINIKQIVRDCNLDVSVVNEETSKLIRAGELYTTVDDQHLLPTNTFHA